MENQSSVLGDGNRYAKCEKRRMCCTLKALVTLLLATSVAGWACADEPSEDTVAQPLLRAPRLPKRVDLRPRLEKWRLQPRSQGKRNTCSVFVTTGAVEFAVSKHYRRGTPLSVEYLNWACNQVINNRTVDRGQFFHDLLKGFEQHGICFEADMPYRNHFDPELKPSEKATQRAKEIHALGLQVHWINPWKPKPGLTDKHLREIKTVLAQGYPVAAGSSHSRLLIGYLDDRRQPGGGVFLAKDSGAAAYNTVTYEFVKQRVGDVFWVDVQAKLPLKTD